MAEANVQITQGSGTNVDAYSVTGAGSQTAYRQAVVLGDPTTGANVATVTAGNALKVDGSGVTQPVSGTVTANAGTGNFTVVQGTGSNLHVAVDSMPTTTVSGTVTANIGTTNGLALDTTVAGIQVSQGSTTSGQKGNLVQGAVTTSAPSYTTAQTSPLSLTTSGALRTDGSGSTQPVSGTVTANAGTGNFTVTQGTGTNLHTVIDSGTVTANAGTNLNTSALALETGGNLATLAGAVTSSVVQANVKQINGVTPLMGNGTTGTGSQRVTIASDNTAFSVNANQAGTWTVQPGNTANSTPWLTQSYGIGRSSLQTNVANGTANAIVTDRNGRTQIVKPNTSNASSAGTAITTATNTTIIAAPSAGTHLKIYKMWAQNSSATGTWCYWGNGSAVKTFPFFLAQNQPFSQNMEGVWELSSATGLFMNTATAGANIEWSVWYETVAD